MHTKAALLITLVIAGGYGLVAATRGQASQVPSGPVAVPEHAYSTPLPTPNSQPLPVSLLHPEATPASQPPMPAPSPLATPTTAAQTGTLSGKALIQRNCPTLESAAEFSVPRAAPCGLIPYIGQVRVYSLSGSLYSVGHADDQGAFLFALPPGNYSLKAGGTNYCPDNRCMTRAMLPFGSVDNIEISTDQETAATLMLDSALR